MIKLYKVLNVHMFNQSVGKNTHMTVVHSNKSSVLNRCADN